MRILHIMLKLLFFIFTILLINACTHEPQINSQKQKNAIFTGNPYSLDGIAYAYQHKGY